MLVLEILIHVAIVLKMDIMQEVVLHHAKFAKKMGILIYMALKLYYATIGFKKIIGDGG